MNDKPLVWQIIREAAQALDGNDDPAALGFNNRKPGHSQVEDDSRPKVSIIYLHYHASFGILS